MFLPIPLVCVSACALVLALVAAFALRQRERLAVHELRTVQRAHDVERHQRNTDESRRAAFLRLVEKSAAEGELIADVSFADRTFTALTLTLGDDGGIAAKVRGEQDLGASQFRAWLRATLLPPPQMRYCELRIKDARLPSQEEKHLSRALHQVLRIGRLVGSESASGVLSESSNGQDLLRFWERNGFSTTLDVSAELSGRGNFFRSLRGYGVTAPLAPPVLHRTAPIA